MRYFRITSPSHDFDDFSFEWEADVELDDCHNEYDATLQIANSFLEHFEFDLEKSKLYNEVYGNEPFEECRGTIDATQVIKRLRCHDESICNKLKLFERDEDLQVFIPSEYEVTPDFFRRYDQGMGSQLETETSLEILGRFLNAGSWNLGFKLEGRYISIYRVADMLKNDSAITRESLLQRGIVPLMWFGVDTVDDNWVIDENITKEDIERYWTDIYDYRLERDITGAWVCFDICEFGLDYPHEEFENVISKCPVPFKCIESIPNFLYETAVTSIASTITDFEKYKSSLMNALEVFGEVMTEDTMCSLTEEAQVHECSEEDDGNYYSFLSDGRLSPSCFDLCDQPPQWVYDQDWDALELDKVLFPNITSEKQKDDLIYDLLDWNEIMSSITKGVETFFRNEYGGNWKDFLN